MENGVHIIVTGETILSVLIIQNVQRRRVVMAVVRIKSVGEKRSGKFSCLFSKAFKEGGYRLLLNRLL